MSDSHPEAALNFSPRSGDDELLIVGIGASAGGIQALKEFFENAPPDSGIAYVVILHLSPEYESQLAQVLQAVTRIPVTQVRERVTVEPNHIYVISPNQHLTIVNGLISVSPNLKIEERRAPVDIFFRTLAESHGPRAVAVVLSGTGANGSMGLKRVKENGGAAFVQNPREAEYNEMPRNAIGTDLVDDVLPVAEIPARIIAYKASLRTVEIPPPHELRQDEHQQALREIFRHLRARTGHDFTNYKRPTLLRRIERRINICRLPDLQTYAALIRDNADEAHALLKDLLISVTNFFRDQQAFEAIEHEVLAQIFQRQSAKDQVRIWVVGCATGEEAYSLAMLCAERAFGVIDAPRVQIFATDIDEDAITTARNGIYTINDAADVSPERLHRFFTKEGEEYRIRREIREMVLFAQHNVLKDPPFSHLDLISCRNLLIYLNNTAQERVMETFHYSLNPGGKLFLGSTESTDRVSDLFTPFNREHHIYKSRTTGPRHLPLPESTPKFSFEQTSFEQTSVAPPLANQEKRALERITYGDLHQQLLEQYAPPSVVINQDFEIVHLSERAGRYLQISGGLPSMNLLKVIREELRPELHTAIYQAVQRQTNVEAKNLVIPVDGQIETINLHVRPVLKPADPGHGFLLILFEKTDESAESIESVFTSPEPVNRQLEDELSHAKARLRSSIEQYEIQAEELKSSNEELQAINEEMRSAAEELETSKEELQSTNEELRTVNQELKVKIEETTLASNNLHNLINSTDIGTIFLDRSFCVRLFTPAVREIFNLISADFGRPLSDITHRLKDGELLQDVEYVLKRLQAVEREVQTVDGRFFLMHILPYRTADDRIQGVVITFVDITERKRAEESRRENETRLAIELADTKLLHQISSQLIQEDNVHILYEQILEAALALMRAEIGSIQVLHPLGNQLQPLVWKGFDPSADEFRKFVRLDADSARGAAFRAGNREIVPDIESDESMAGAEESDFYRRSNIRAMQSTPLISRSGEMVGIISTYWKERHQPSERELHLLDVLARQSADLIERKEAAELIAADLKDTRLLRDLSARLASESDVQTLYQEILTVAIAIARADAGTVQILDEQTQELVLAAHQQIPPNLVDHFHRVKADSNTSCGVALAKNERAVVDFDVPETEDPDGSLRLYLRAGYRSAQSTPLISLSGQPIGMLSTHWRVRYHPTERELRFLDLLARQAADLIEHQQSEAVLRESEERLRLAMEAGQMGTWDWNLITGEAVWSPEHNRMFDLPPDKLTGNAEEFFQRIHPEDRESFAQKWQTAIDRRTDFVAEMRSRHRDGSIHWISSSGRPFYDSNGNPVRMIGIVRDISNLKETEIELLRARTHLEETVQKRTQDLYAANTDRLRLLRQLVQTQEAERQRISRELHDNFGQQLTALRLGLESLAEPKTRKSREQVKLLREIIKRLDREVDFLSHELRPISLDELGLVSAIANFTEEWSKLFQIPADFHTAGLSRDRLSSEIEINLYRIAQEALNNVAKHAQATHVAVILERRDHHVVLIVEDNGIGIAPPLDGDPEVTRDRLGLINIRERATLIGGTIEIESSSGNGTAIFVRVPHAPSSEQVEA